MNIALLTGFPPLDWLYQTLSGPIGPAKVIILIVATIVYCPLQLYAIYSIGENYRHKKETTYRHQQSPFKAYSTETNAAIEEALAKDSYYIFLRRLRVFLSSLADLLYAALLTPVFYPIVATFTKVTAIINPFFLSWIIGAISGVLAIALWLVLRFLINTFANWFHDVRYARHKTNCDYENYVHAEEVNRKLAENADKETF